MRINGTMRYRGESLYTRYLEESGECCAVEEVGGRAADIVGPKDSLSEKSHSRPPSLSTVSTTTAPSS